MQAAKVELVLPCELHVVLNDGNAGSQYEIRHQQ